MGLLPFLGVENNIPKVSAIFIFFFLKIFVRLKFIFSQNLKYYTTDQFHAQTSDPVTIVDPNQDNDLVSEIEEENVFPARLNILLRVRLENMLLLKIRTFLMKMKIDSHVGEFRPWNTL